MQLDRGYAEKDEGSMQFWPTPLGEALISAYRKMGLANLWLPSLRGVIERNIAAVAAGQRSKESVLAEAVAAFRNDFSEAQAKVGSGG
jgi:DNA topoisomerase-3